MPHTVETCNIFSLVAKNYDKTNQGFFLEINENVFWARDENEIQSIGQVHILAE